MNFISLLLFALITAPASVFGNGDLERTKVNTKLLWQRSAHRMASVEVNKASVGGILGPFLSYQFLLPMTQLRAGIGYAGARTRLRRFVRDLLRGGRSIKVGAVGGSVTWGQGTSDISNAWFSVVGHWLVDGFPRVNVTARNGAIPATPTSYMVMCLENSVDPDVDLVFVEYQLNDGVQDKVFNNEVVMVMERLVRRLLALPGKPAVVLMQVPSHGMAEDPPGRPFYDTMEDLEGALAQYYDVQYLSLRTALHHISGIERREGFRWRELFVDHHPGDAGNHIMADLVAFLIQETALELLIDPYGSEDERLLAQPLTEPMHAGNNPPNSPMCIRDERLKLLVIAANGFAYGNEGTEEKPKWGFVAHTPGANLTVRLDTRRPNGDLVAVFVQHLKSYEHMGIAQLSCTSGCTCGTVDVDAHITRRVSQDYQAKLSVSSAEACEVTMTVLGRTNSGEHKFKVTGVVVADTPTAATVMEQVGYDGGRLPEHLVPKVEVITRRRG